ncbi:hypothetical protein BMI79_03115 [Serratia oryzae]|uniref:Uncharacterized protein n=1 Tax=Serratia oryzae TaxID=2034155 RepID=A0A1S8CPX6_9GAMM|nr:hypothetical protein BMI79_03115 [Serratia oryzae]
MADSPYLLLLFLTQAIGGHWAYRRGSSVFRGGLPALPGAYTELNFAAGHRPAGTGSDGLIYPRDKLLAFLSGCSSWLSSCIPCH